MTIDQQIYREIEIIIYEFEIAKEEISIYGSERVTKLDTSIGKLKSLLNKITENEIDERWDKRTKKRFEFWSFVLTIFPTAVAVGLILYVFVFARKNVDHRQKDYNSLISLQDSVSKYRDSAFHLIDIRDTIGHFPRYLEMGAYKRIDSLRKKNYDSISSEIRKINMVVDYFEIRTDALKDFLHSDK
jgi:hypothetical protein